MVSLSFSAVEAEGDSGFFLSGTGVDVAVGVGRSPVLAGVLTVVLSSFDSTPGGRGGGEGAEGGGSSGIGGGGGGC